MSRLALALVLVAGIATAEPPERVLLADPDPELRHAVQSSLAPWKLAVVVEKDVPANDATAHARADATGARFVVWREGNQLVVFDRTRDASERRPAREGTFDPITAAAAALTVKTMMRLPPVPPEEQAEIFAPPPPPPAPRGRVEVRISAGVGARLAGGDVGLGVRVPLAVMVRPSARGPWRLGVRGDLGPAVTVDGSGFKGTWSDWALLGAASFAVQRGAWEIEPWLGAGVTRGTLDGIETASTARTEGATSFTARGGADARRRFGAFSVGLDLELGATPTAPTYTRATPGMGTPSIFEASKFSLVTSLVLAVELGR